MGNRELGRSITAAMRGLLGIQRDVVTLAASLEKIMFERGWVVAKELLPKENGDVHHRLFVLFTRERAKADAVTCAVLVSLNLTPPKPLDEPYLLVGIIRFDSATSATSIWNDWYDADCMRVLRYVVDAGKAMPLSHDLRRPHYVPKADHATAFAIPLSDFTGPVELEQLVVAPTLELLNLLSAA